MDMAALSSEYGDNDYMELERVGSVGLHDWRIIMAYFGPLHLVGEFGESYGVMAFFALILYKDADTLDGMFFQV